jgi:hypothetical protein
VRAFGAVWWTAAFLLAGTLALEARSCAKGGTSVVFGRGAAPEAGPAAGGDRAHGPTADFPFVSPVAAREKTPGRVRLWVGAASHAEGYGTTAERTFPNRLPALLRERGRDLEVLDPESVPGADLRAAEAELREAAPAWRPDVVLVYHLSNDLNGMIQDLVAGSAPGARAASARAWADAAGPSTPLARAFSRTFVRRWLRQNVTARVASARLSWDDVEPAADVEFERRLRAVVRAARDLGAEPVLATFAVSLSPAEAEDPPHGVRLWLALSDSRLSARGWSRVVSRWNGVVRRVAAEEGLRLADLDAALGGRSELFSDFVHWTEEGHAAAARVVADALAAPAPARGR